ncbi:hypothetical protein KsCSTR_07850 [Candidatus Kuenenia stuttgartiensis]|uniref:Uncharacterized protein n=1 Tax=Kuenenia stuttgartiensis TaxID=174633 RepID=Q1PZE2_KUEST|nr:hypothetical protein KsCSTR_07850 [Candidatus Kuenenia stuttgartiensis]CAJ72460.1 unknown protein [Candidatus Kuenenia stuttgartiensis]
MCVKFGTVLSSIRRREVFRDFFAGRKAVSDASIWISAFLCPYMHCPCGSLRNVYIPLFYLICN